MGIWKKRSAENSPPRPERKRRGTLWDYFTPDSDPVTSVLKQEITFARERLGSKSIKHPGGEFMCGMRDLLKLYGNDPKDEVVASKIARIRKIFKDDYANVYEELNLSKAPITANLLKNANQLIEHSRNIIKSLNNLPSNERTTASSNFGEQLKKLLLTYDNSLAEHHKKQRPIDRDKSGDTFLRELIGVINKNMSDISEDTSNFLGNMMKESQASHKTVRGDARYQYKQMKKFIKENKQSHPNLCKAVRQVLKEANEARADDKHFLHSVKLTKKVVPSSGLRPKR